MQYKEESIYHSFTPFILIFLAILAAPAAAGSQECPYGANVFEKSDDPPPRLGESRSVPSLITLEPANLTASDRIAEMMESNQRDAVPIQNGFVRTFPPQRFLVDERAPAATSSGFYRGGALSADDDTVVWSTRLHIADSYAFRIHLEGVNLPSGTRLWVYRSAGEALGPFGSELLDSEGGIWLPAIDGPEVYLEFKVPREELRRGAVLRFHIKELMEIFDVESWAGCANDATCITSGMLSVISQYYHSVARLSFVKGSASYLCSGALVNDIDDTGFRPFLLTANHCFDTQSSASSLTSYFYYKTSTCNGSAPSLGSVPQVSGATLLATNTGTDFTFVELSTNPVIPEYTTYLGWTTATPSNGQTMHRISHPSGTAQKYSSTTFLSSGGIACGSLPRPNFHYSSSLSGSTTGGSSGAPVINASGQILGQLYGKCHYTTWDECNYGTFNTVDGAFAATFPSISEWVYPPWIFGDGFESGDTSKWSSQVP
jgi:hypothetical protein